MGITNSNKQIDVTQIDCEGTLKVTLALAAAPDISSNPTDIVLVLDRSGSMAGSPLANMKTGAKTFIDIIDEATDSSQDGTIGSGSRIGIVSFADTAVADTQLITSVAVLKTAVDALTAGGSTNHADAFAKAVQLFDTGFFERKGNRDVYGRKNHSGNSSGSGGGSSESFGNHYLLYRADWGGRYRRKCAQ